MRVTLDLYRAADGRFEGTVYGPGDAAAGFAGLLDLIRVLEGLDPEEAEQPGRTDGRTPGTEGRG